MKKEDLIKLCRYYKGEDKIARNTKSSFWNYEQIWIDETMKAVEQGDRYDGLLRSCLDDYLAYGLADFNHTDDTPITLKALLFNRYSHWMRIDIDAFKEWYEQDYIGRDS